MVLTLLSFLLVLWRVWRLVTGWLGLRKEEEEYRFPPFKVKMTYRDNKGKVTKRRVDIYRSYPEEKEHYFRAFCHLRGREQLFKVSGVVGEVIDLEKKESVDVRKLLRHI